MIDSLQELADHLDDLRQRSLVGIVFRRVLEDRLIEFTGCLLDLQHPQPFLPNPGLTYVRRRLFPECWDMVRIRDVADREDLWLEVYHSIGLEISDELMMDIEGVSVVDTDD